MREEFALRVVADSPQLVELDRGGEYHYSWGI
jgi:hypothetical protein